VGADDVFSIGDVVALRVDPRRTGPVVEVLPEIGGVPRYRLFVSASDQPVYAHDQLIPGNPPFSLGAEPLRLDAPAFLAHLTALRLRHPQNDYLYSLRAARIRYVPFQFKPLMRLLRADRYRLLIADEVGVGKTIEAGLVLRELQARKTIERVLIMCPKALVTKWQAEMRRFDERFRILSGAQLKHCLNEAHLEGQWPVEFNRSILPYELARREEYLFGDPDRQKRIHGLQELDPAPSFDLVIADEAHHLRNPETLGYALADYVQQLSDAVIFLSATPVQTSSTDLFNLLHLLRSDLFPSFDVFQEQLEPNRYVGQAIRVLRAPEMDRSTRSKEASTAIDQALATTWGRRAMFSDPLVTDIKRRLAQPLDDRERVAAIRDLEEIHTLATVMNRTRRRDIGRFTIREPRTQRVSLTEPQQRLYDEVVRFRAELLLEEHDPFVVRFVLPNIERQAASSINALAANVRTFLDARGFDPALLTDDPEGMDEDVPESSIDLTERASRVLAAAEAVPLDQDPKVEALSTIVSDAIGEETGPGKVLIFSFFIHTVNYVASALAAQGCRVATIHGGVHEADREHLRARFRLDRQDPNAIDVLVSSEVGCEGLDFEFCDRLVNFDIPWNPMRVEQRIGRIDRFGQTADKVLIHNLVTEGTVEDRVWMRCFERLGIFRETVGDLEEVLGEITAGLESVLKTPGLSPEQEAEKALQLADNAIRLAEEQRRLEEQSAELFDLGAAFTEEVTETVEGGGYVTGGQLRGLVQWFLDDAFGGKLTQAEDGLDRLRLNAEARRELTEQLTSVRGRDVSWKRFADRIDDGDLRLTFNDDVAADQRGAEFITPVHPLAVLAAGHGPEEAVGLAVSVPASAGLAPGHYEFLVERWETISARPDQSLRVFACAMAGDLLEDDQQSALMACLPQGQALSEHFPELAHEHFLLESADQARRAGVASLRQRNDALVDRRLASLDRDFDQRRRTIERQLEASSDERLQRMRRGQLRKAAEDHAVRKRELEAARDVDIVASLAAVGTVSVEPA